MLRSAVVVLGALFAGGCSFDASGATGGGDGGGGAVDPDARADAPDASARTDGGAGTPDALPADAEPSCTPGESYCQGRTLHTCGESGNGPDPDLDVECEFTCAAASCRMASNLPSGAYGACDGSAPRLDPPQGATVSLLDQPFDGSPAVITCDPDCGDSGVTAIEANVVAQQGGPNLALFCLASLRLRSDITLAPDHADPVGNPVVLLVDADARIEGRLSVGGSAAQSNRNGVGGPGGGAGGRFTNGDGDAGRGPCGGEGGTRQGPLIDSAAGGGGGGGFGGAGGDGGEGADSSGGTSAGGSGAGTCGTSELVPLVAGSGGGSGADGSCGGDCGWAGGGGGGAIQIASREAIRLSGTIASTGGNGYGEPDDDAGLHGGAGAGGSGGAILLEAPRIEIRDGGALVVTGGDGAASGAGEGGSGDAGDRKDGEDVTATPDPGEGGPGGGGGAGRVRINRHAGVSGDCEGPSDPSSVCTLGELAPAP